MDRSREQQLLSIAREFGTPVYVYDAAILRRQLASLKAFDRVRFAQKACTNLHVQRLLRSEGALVDCVSLGELDRALAAGFQLGKTPAEIVYTADILTDGGDRAGRVVRRARQRGLGGHADAARGAAPRAPGLAADQPGLWPRPQPEGQHRRRVEQTRHLAREPRRRAGAGRTATGSTWSACTCTSARARTSSTWGAWARRWCEAVRRCGRDLRAVSGGGGLSIPYRAERARHRPERSTSRSGTRRGGGSKRMLGHAVELEIEPGRYLVGPAGVLLAEVRATKRMGQNHFTLVDAGFNDLVRPSMYGAYHELSLLSRVGRCGSPQLRPTLVAGPLCESGDVFTQDASGQRAAARAARGARGRPPRVSRRGRVRRQHVQQLQLAPARARGADRRRAHHA